MSVMPIAAWSRAAASHLLPGLISPFTWSILGPAAEQADRSRYAALGHELPPAAPLWRRYAGRAYVDIAALQGAEQALFGEGQAAASLAQRLLGRSLEQRQAALVREMAAAAPQRYAAAAAWADRVEAQEWRQSSLLQVMEELEPQAAAVLSANQQLAASLGRLRRRITRWLADWLPTTADDSLEALMAGLDGRLRCASYRRALWLLGQAAGQDQGAATFLAAGRWQDWPETLPAGPFRQALEAFLRDWGRWAEEPLEAAKPRWQEAPAQLLAWLAEPANQAVAPPPDPDGCREQRSQAATSLVRQLSGKQRRQFEPAFQQIQQLCSLLDEGGEALLRVMAAARIWALAAGREAAADGRLAAVEDVFLLELEELKQMMTGEWSSPEQVRPIVEERRAEQAVWASQEPPAVLEG